VQFQRQRFKTFQCGSNVRSNPRDIYPCPGSYPHNKVRQRNSGSPIRYFLSTAQRQPGISYYPSVFSLPEMKCGTFGDRYLYRVHASMILPQVADPLPVLASQLGAPCHRQRLTRTQLNPRRWYNRVGLLAPAVRVAKLL
jgi:hypothetical protein